MLSSKKMGVVLIAAALAIGATGAVSGSAFAEEAKGVIRADLPSFDVVNNRMYVENKVEIDVAPALPEQQESGVEFYLDNVAVEKTTEAEEAVENVTSEPAPQEAAQPSSIRVKSVSNPKNTTEKNKMSTKASVLLPNKNMLNILQPVIKRTHPVQYVCEYDEYKKDAGEKQEANSGMTDKNVEDLVCNTVRGIHNTKSNYFRSISLSISSYRQGVINLNTIAMANDASNKVGVKSIKLQKFQNGRWTSVRGWANKFEYNTYRFNFSRTISGLSSDDKYRVVATYVLRDGAITATVTRTTGTLKCR